jgi:hypothetical protein
MATVERYRVLTKRGGVAVSTSASYLRGLVFECQPKLRLAILAEVSLWLSLVPPVKCWDSALKRALATQSSFIFHSVKSFTH